MRSILEGFTRCSVTVFRQTFAHLLVAERLQQLRYLTNRNDSSRLIDIKRLCKEANNLFNSLNVSNEWNIPQKHCMLVSIAVIPVMASLNAPSLSTKVGSIRPRPNSPRMEAVVEAEVDAVVEVALPVGCIGDGGD